MLVYQRVNGRTSKIQVNISFMYNIEKLSLFSKKCLWIWGEIRVFQGKQLMENWKLHSWWIQQISTEGREKGEPNGSKTDKILSRSWYSIKFSNIPLYIPLYIYTLWDYQWYTSFLWELFICIIYVYSTRRNFRKKRICSNRFFRAYENVKSGLRMHLFSIFFSHNSIGIQQKMHNPSQIPLFW